MDLDGGNGTSTDDAINAMPVLPRHSYKGDLSDFGFNESAINDFTTHLSPASDIDVAGVMASTVFNALVFVVLMISYEILRKAVPSVYASKRQQARMRGESRSLSRTSSGDEGDDDVHTPQLSTIPLDWVLPVYQVPWSQVRKAGGLDAYMFLRYIRMCLRITSVSAFWGMVILWPVYAKGGGPYDQLSWYHFSMANIDQGSWQIWVPTIFIYLFSAYVFFAMRQEYKHYVALRMEFLGKGGKRKTTAGKNGPELDQMQQSYSVMVERIPLALRSDQSLFDYFDRLFPGRVHSACVIVSAPDLEAVYRRCLEVTRSLEKSIAHVQATGSRPMHIVGRPFLNSFGPLFHICRDAFDMDAAEEGTTPPRGKLVDSIVYFTQELIQINKELWAGQRKKALIAETGNVPMRANNAWVQMMADYAKQVGDVVMVDSMQTNALAVGKNLSPSGDFRGSLINSSHIYNQYGSMSEEYGQIAWSSDDESVDMPYADPGHKDGHDAERENLLNVPCATAETCAVSALKPTIARRLGVVLGLDFLVVLVRGMNKRLNCFEPKSAAGTAMSSTGFVTLVTHQDGVVAACAPLTHKPDALEVTPAPDNRELLWNNAAVGLQRQRGKAILANILFGIGVIFWSIPLAAIQAFAKIDEIAQIPGMEWLANIGRGDMTHFINDYLPVVALLFLITILPFAFEYIAVSYEQRKTISDVQDSIVGRYFWYQVANIYVTVTAGSIWAALATIIDQPAALLEILGESIPQMVGYFLSLLITKILAGLPMLILRGGALSRMFLLQSCFRQKKLTQRELDEVYRKETLFYGWEYPTQILVIMIAFAYACISPVILPVSAAYFLGALIVYKKQILYVYTPTYEGGGKLFPFVCDRTLFGLIISQLTFIGYSLIRKGKTQVLFLSPLPCCTLYMMYYFRARYATPSQKLSFECAIELDHIADVTISANENAGGGVTPGASREKLEETFQRDYYYQPVLVAEAGRPLPYRREEGIDDLTAATVNKLQGGVSRFQIMIDGTKQGVTPGSTPTAKNTARRHLDVQTM